MRDVVIPYLANYRQDDRIFRWTLRSMEQRLHDIGRMVIVGDLPEWVEPSTVTYVPFGNPYGKFQNLCIAVLTAIGGANIKGDFLYSADDVVHIADTSADEVPFLYRHEAMPDEETMWADWYRPGIDDKNYFRMLLDTRKMLVDNGYGVVDFEGHTTRPMNADDTKEVTRMLTEAGPGKFGYELSCLFGNVAAKHREIKTAHQEDMKIGPNDDFAEVSKTLADRYTFSYSPSMLDKPEFVDYMHVMFGKQSRFEKWT